MSVGVSGSLQTGALDTASASDFVALLHELAQMQGQSGGMPFGSANVTVNESGPCIDRSVHELANFVYAGNVWVDYCHHPMMNRPLLGVPCAWPLNYGGFGTFSQLTLGTELAYGSSPPLFGVPPASGLFIPGGLPAAMFIGQDPSQIAGLAVPLGFNSLPWAPYSAQEGNYGPTWVLPMFGIQYGQGWYFYAAGGPSAALDPSIYAAFVTIAVNSPEAVLPGGHNVTPPPAGSSLHVATSGLPAATVGVPYSATLEAAGGSPPYSWSAEAALPTGISLSSAGEVSGTFAAAGTASLPVRVTDGAGDSASAVLTVQVAAGGTGGKLPSSPSVHSLWGSLSTAGKVGVVVGALALVGGGYALWKGAQP